MKILLALLLLAALLYLGIVLAPLGIFFHSVYALVNSEPVLPLEFDGLYIEEAGVPSEPEASQIQAVSLTITEVELGKLLTDFLAQTSYPCLELSTTETAIAPEMLSVTLSWRCQFLRVPFFEFTVFSEWWVRLREGPQINKIEVKPRIIQVPRRSRILNWGVNWAKVWPYVTHTHDSDGWLAVVSSSSRLNIHDMALQDQECWLSLSF